MGCGKSTVSKILAQELSLMHVDIDDVITSRTNKSIPDIFRQYGETVFRKLESSALNMSLNLEAAVVATGGGLPCFNGNMDVMIKNGTTVYLKIDPESLVQRLYQAEQKRPLLANKSREELFEFITNHLQERSPFYDQASLIVDANQSPKVISQLIVQRLSYEDKD